LGKKRYTIKDLGYFVLGLFLTFSPALIAAAVAPVIIKEAPKIIKETRELVKEVKATRGSKS